MSREDKYPRILNNSTETGDDLTMETKSLPELVGQVSDRVLAISTT